MDKCFVSSLMRRCEPYIALIGGNFMLAKPAGLAGKSVWEWSAARYGGKRNRRAAGKARPAVGKTNFVAILGWQRRFLGSRVRESV